MLKLELTYTELQMLYRWLNYALFNTTEPIQLTDGSAAVAVLFNTEKQNKERVHFNRLENCAESCLNRLFLQLQMKLAGLVKEQYNIQLEQEKGWALLDKLEGSLFEMTDAVFFNRIIADLDNGLVNK